jgi:hypothetical protein
LLTVRTDAPALNAVVRNRAKTVRALSADVTKQANMLPRLLKISLLRKEVPPMRGLHPKANTNYTAALKPGV